jgi:hypothetical protein
MHVLPLSKSVRTGMRSRENGKRIAETKCAALSAFFTGGRGKQGLRSRKENAALNRYPREIRQVSPGIF